MKFLLFPFSLIYAAVMAVRNWMFDRGLLSSSSAPIPTICVGNLSVGGSGKTPHTEYLLRLLQSEGWHCGMLSRGYGRCSKGYVAGNGKNALEIGDEPWQIMHSCAPAKVSVCEKRPEGLKRMLEESDAPKVVVLDDAYQHRYITAGLYILLTDYARPYFRDYVLPAGRLREARSGAKRADIIVVTKCPGDLSETEQQRIRKCLRLLPHQSLFFSKMEYGILWNPFSEADPLTHGTNVNAPICNMRTLDALLVCAIAHPEEFVKYFQAQCASVNVLSFPDHHRFTAADISAIADRAQDADIIITTQKDWARLSECDLPDVIKQKLCVQPIEVRFLHQTENTFNQIILDYVTKDSTNSRMD